MGLVVLLLAIPITIVLLNRPNRPPGADAPAGNAAAAPALPPAAPALPPAAPAPPPAPEKVVFKPRFTLTGHQADVTSLVFGSDGKLLASADTSGLIKTWDLDQRQERLTINGAKPFWHVEQLVLSPDCKVLAGLMQMDEKSARSTAPGPNSECCLWDAATGDLLATIPLRWRPLRAVFSPDSRIMAVIFPSVLSLGAPFFGPIHFYDLATGLEWGTGAVPDEPSLYGTVPSLGRVYLGPPPTHGSAIDYPIRDLVFSPDSRQVATLAGHSQAQEVKLWDVATGREKKIFKQPAEFSWSADALKFTGAVAFTAEGELAVASPADGKVRLFDVSTGDEKRSLSPPAGFQLNFMTLVQPDRKQLVATGVDVANPSQAMGWDISSDKLLGNPPIGAHFGIIAPGLALQATTIDPQAPKVKGQPEDHKTIYLWNTEWSVPVAGGQPAADFAASESPQLIPACVAVIPKNAGSGSFQLAFSPDGTILAHDGDMKLQLRNIAPGPERGNLLAELEGAYFGKFAPDEKVVVSRRNPSKPGEFVHELWDWKANKTTPLDDSKYYALISIDGKTYVKHEQQGASVWSLTTRKKIADLGSLNSASYSEDGSLFADAKQGGGVNGVLVQIWDTSTWKVQQHFIADEGGAINPVFSPDGKLLVTSGRTPTLWDLESSEARAKLALTDASFSKFVFSRDSRTLIACGGLRSGATSPITGPITLWDTGTGRLLGFADPVPRFGDVNAPAGNANAESFLGASLLAFSPDGRILASDSGDSIALWGPRRQ